MELFESKQITTLSEGRNESRKNHQFRKDGKCGRSGKICYDSKTEAEKNKERINSQETDRHIQSAYQCTHCQKWHLSSQHKNENKEGRKKSVQDEAAARLEALKKKNRGT